MRQSNSRSVVLAGLLPPIGWILAHDVHQSSEEKIFCMISAKVEILIKQLGNWNPVGSWNAVESLAKIGVPAVPALIEALNVHENAVRWYAAHALGRINDPSAVNALTEALRQHEDYEVRQVAAEGLGKPGNPSVVPVLIESLRQDTNGHVRGAAAAGLAEAGGPSTVPILIEVLTGQDHEVRVAVAYALGELGDSSGVPALISALKDTLVRFNAAGALGKICSSSAIPALLAALEDENLRVSFEAALALMKIEVAASYSAVPVFIQGLIEDIGFQNMRLEAALALKQLGDSTTVPRMILAASRFSAQERIIALDALRNLRKPREQISRTYRIDPDPHKKAKYRNLRFDFPDSRTLCRLVLAEGDAAASAGAQEVLNYLDGLDLVRASEHDVSTEAQELLRTPKGGSVDAHPETLLIATDAPDEDVKAPPTIWHRIFGTWEKSGLMCPL
jgi:HEAT repeat protein